MHHCKLVSRINLKYLECLFPWFAKLKTILVKKSQSHTSCCCFKSRHLLRREPKYISVLLILLVSALLLCNPSYIVLKAVRLSETYSPTYPAAYSPTRSAAYSPTYPAAYSPIYSATYSPTNSAAYSPTYTAAYSPTNSAAYSPTYSAAYTATYPAAYSPTYPAAYSAAYEENVVSDDVSHFFLVNQIRPGKWETPIGSPSGEPSHAIETILIAHFAMSLLILFTSI